MTIFIILLLGQDQKAIDKAIDKGVACLRTKQAQGRGIAPQEAELVVWTLLHAGCKETDPTVQALLGPMLQRPSGQTYNVALRAMILSKLDPKRYQAQLKECAQFFVDTQCENGQWGYGQHFKANAAPPSPPVMPSPWKSKKKGETETIPTIKVARTPLDKNSPPPAKQGDNSNSQYASLGLRACALANIEFPEETLKRAKGWWERTQQGDGSWMYGDGYGIGFGKGGYGSMTCGAVGALAILKTMLKEEIAEDRQLQRGYAWLGSNFSVTENPKTTPMDAPGGKKSSPFYFYYLYSMERAGDLTGTGKFGDHDWYPEGARELLKTQRADGAWGDASTESEIWSTCFAILFLKRATQPLPTIKTGSGR